MDKLLEQVAQTLKIPTDALQTVINNYPQIRHEYAIYKALHTVSFALGALVLLNTLVTGIFAIIIASDIDKKNNQDGFDNDQHKRNRKAFYISITTLITGIIIVTVCEVISAFAAPDIHLIKDLMSR